MELFETKQKKNEGKIVVILPSLWLRE